MSNEFVMVPREPTPEMLAAAKKSGVIDPRVSGYCYELMVAAAPNHQGEPMYQLRNTVVGNVWRDADKEAYDSAANLDEYERRVLYTHADPGEVERTLECQRREFSHAQTVEHRKWAELVDSLKDRQAKLDALLRDISNVLDSWRNTDDLEEIGDRVAAMISASAEPSAPIEIDDLRIHLEAMCKLWPEDLSDDGSGRMGFKSEVAATVAKARAALVRKP